MIKYKDFIGDDADWQINCFIWTNRKIDAMNVETISPHTLRLWYKKKDDECFDANDDKLPPACKDNPFSYNGSVLVSMTYTKNDEQGAFVGTGFYDYDIKKWVLMVADNNGIYKEYIICNEKSGIKVLNYRIKT